MSVVVLEVDKIGIVGGEYYSHFHGDVRVADLHEAVIEDLFR